MLNPAEKSAEDPSTLQGALQSLEQSAERQPEPQKQAVPAQPSNPQCPESDEQRPRRLSAPHRRLFPARASALTEQDCLNQRFANLDPQNSFGTDGVMIFSACGLQPPPNFKDVWLDIDTKSMEYAFTESNVSEMQKKGAILVIGDGADPDQLNKVCAIVKQLDNLLDESLPLLWIMHQSLSNNNPDGVSRYLDVTVYDQVLKSGADDLVPSETCGIMLAVAVKSRLIKMQAMCGKVKKIVQDRHELNCRAYKLEESIKHLVWEYLRQRLQTGLPPVSIECPPGIPSRLDDLIVGNLLGKGASGEVYELQTSCQGPSGQIVNGPSGQVIKCMEKGRFTNLSGLKSVKHQLKLMKICSTVQPHPTIVQLYQVYHIDTHILFRMENGGPLNLFRRLKLRDRGPVECRLSDRKILSLMYQSAQAISHLHSINIAHRDLKPENICIKETVDSIVFKLCDFDVAVECEADQVVGNCCGTFPFCAPEVYLQEFYSPFPPDIWSLGIIQGEVMCGLHLLERVLRLSVHRTRYLDEVQAGRRPMEDQGVQKFLTQKIRDYYSREHAASDMLAQKIRHDCEHLAAPLAPLLDGMIQVPVLSRLNAVQVLQMSERLVQQLQFQEEQQQQQSVQEEADNNTITLQTLDHT